MKREVRRLDIRSVEAPKMTVIQMSTGNQALRKIFERDTARWNQSGTLRGKPIVIRFANVPGLWQSRACL